MPIGRGYMAFMIATIFGSIFFMFLIEEYPKYYNHDNPVVIAVEAFPLVAFSIDFLLQLMPFRLSDWKNGIFLIFDGLAILPSLAIFAMALGWDVHPEDVVVFTLLRLFRLLRVLKLLRMGNLLVDVLGVSVFTMVFGAIALHLGIRVFTQMLQPLFGIDLHEFIEGPVLLMAVTAVGSVSEFRWPSHSGWSTRSAKRSASYIVLLWMPSAGSNVTSEMCSMRLLIQPNARKSSVTSNDGWRVF